MAGGPVARLRTDLGQLAQMLSPRTALNAMAMAARRPFKVPRKVEIVDELPRNATGKVLKRELLPRIGA